MKQETKEGREAHADTLAGLQIRCVRLVQGLRRAASVSAFYQAIADFARGEIEHERNWCAKIAKSFALNDGSCENLSGMDPETGARECRLDVRGDTCLCALQTEVAEAIEVAIRARGQA